VPPFTALSALVRAGSQLGSPLLVQRLHQGISRGGNRIIALDLCSGRRRLAVERRHVETVACCCSATTSSHPTALPASAATSSCSTRARPHRGRNCQVIENQCPSKSWAPHWHPGERCDAPARTWAPPATRASKAAALGRHEHRLLDVSILILALLACLAPFDRLGLQLPDVGGGRDRVERGHVDAAHGSRLAGAHTAHAQQCCVRGVVMALQFGPPALLLPLTAMRRSPRPSQAALRHQAGAGALALGLGVLTVTGLVRCGTCTCSRSCSAALRAFDGPARQTFVSELVSEAELSNAVALNFHLVQRRASDRSRRRRVLIASVGTGWVFVINAASFAAVLCSLSLLRKDEPVSERRAVSARGSLSEGFRYVWQRNDLKAVLLMLFLIGTFGINFPIFISSMSVSVFHRGAGTYGLLTSTMAVGSVAGALLSARRAKTAHVDVADGRGAVRCRPNGSCARAKATCCSVPRSCLLA